MKAAIERDFPFEWLSALAEAESWRKEIHRPVYHIHKWWARRLGSVFRGILLGSLCSEKESVQDAFYSDIRFEDAVVFDPFMGSGTTVGEARKLGCRAIGFDINPVAYRLVRAALTKVDREKLLAAYAQVEKKAGRQLRRLYETVDDRGQRAEVLYYFWVKQLPCPDCRGMVDLFSTRVFARHAYPKKHPDVQVSCPSCDGVFQADYQDRHVDCPHCSAGFDPKQGAAKGAHATCGRCETRFSIVERTRALGRIADHRMYAKLVLRQDGTKVYLPISQADEERYVRAAQDLEALPSAILPTAKIPDGHNTRQILNHGYRRWADMFNDRQKYGLSTLAGAIMGLEAGPEREALLLLFSGALEFNNMFASYKGEGTGAVRHLFSHHVLKPERMPIEANIWGTPKSSGAFSRLFESRLLRALNYQEAPFELALEPKRRVHKTGLSAPMAARISPSPLPEKGEVHVACASSADTGLRAGAVDLVVTDPPFFDNVHYSELADFFYAWHAVLFGESQRSTRHAEEVQDPDAQHFSSKLAAVMTESHRVLKDDGLFVFTYHHARREGWQALVSALAESGLSAVAAYPIKAELSVATPKSQAKRPIDFDMVLVTKKRKSDRRALLALAAAEKAATRAGQAKIERFERVGRRVEPQDRDLIERAELLVALSAGREGAGLVEVWAAAEGRPAAV